MSDWRAFFRQHGANSVRFTFTNEPIAVESLYQIFRERLLYEIFQAACRRGDDELAGTIESALAAVQSNSGDKP